MTKAPSLSSVLTSVEHAGGLPNAHYVDQEVFDEERRAVFFGNWSGIGFGKDIPEPGDAKPVDFLACHSFWCVIAMVGSTSFRIPAAIAG